MNRAEDERKQYFTVEKCTPETAAGSADGILSVYKEGWLSTYPNQQLGITGEKLAAYFHDLQAMTEDWKRNILSDPNRSVWISRETESGKLVGFCIAKKDTAENELEYIYILPDCQGRSLGRRLMEEALVWMGEEKPVVLYGAAYNTRAIDFYKKYGFSLSAEAPAPKILPDGTRLPTMKMERPALYAAE